MSTSTVAIVRCSSYDRAAVADAVAKGIDLLQLPSEFMALGERILLKPNCLWASTPDRAVTTHPEVFRAVAEELRKRWKCELSYGDSPGGVLPPLHSLRKAGFAGVAEELGIALADFENGEWVSCPRGKLCRKLFMARGVLDTDGVVSMPKLKSHGFVRFTGAVKNQFGCVPGLSKGEYHAQFPDVRDFCRALVDICAFVAPRLYVMDGVVAMEGNGPQSGDPCDLGVLLFATDPVALDAAACRIIDLDTAFVPTIGAGEEAGLGTGDLSRIRIVGEPLESVVKAGFEIVRQAPSPAPTGGIRGAVRRLTTPRPKIDKGLCTRCGTCVEVCPVAPKAVDWPGGEEGAAVPVYDYDRCIRCFCCQEMCPSRAVAIHAPLMRRLLPPLSYVTLLANRIRSRALERQAR